jgi:hypothetical protein
VDDVHTLAADVREQAAQRPQIEPLTAFEEDHLDAGIPEASQADIGAGDVRGRPGDAERAAKHRRVRPYAQLLGDGLGSSATDDIGQREDMWLARNWAWHRAIIAAAG